MELATFEWTELILIGCYKSWPIRERRISSTHNTDLFNFVHSQKYLQRKKEN